MLLVTIIIIYIIVIIMMIIDIIKQDSCARMLLFRGADKEGLNYAGQTPYQVSALHHHHHDNCL